MTIIRAPVSIGALCILRGTFWAPSCPITMTSLTSYMRMEHIDPVEDLSFYLPGAGTWDEYHKAKALRARERRQRLDILWPFYPVESDEIDGN